MQGADVRVCPSEATRELWGVVLAGGQGVRLRPLIRLVYGDERPKQFAALLGSRSLLRQTLDRVTLAIAAERTHVVTVRSHARYMADEVLGSPRPRVLIQPEDRGTAAAILVPVHLIHAHHPDATVAVFPSDHFVLGETAFMAHVAELAAVVERHPDIIAVVGVTPTAPEPEYGWAEPGEPLDKTSSGPVCGVRRFWEKPSPQSAQGCLERGWLWNTFVLVAKARALIDAGQQALPQVHDRLSHIAAFAGTEDEAWAIQQAYVFALTANFSHAVLETCSRLAVSKLTGVLWSDWGTPRRVVESLKGAGLTPPWLSRLERVS